MVSINVEYLYYPRLYGSIFLFFIFSRIKFFFLDLNLIVFRGTSVAQSL